MARNVNTEKLLQGLQQIGCVMSRMSRLEEERDAYQKMWDVVTKKGEGIKETEIRQTLHALLDQYLDARAEAHRLANSLPSVGGCG